MGRGDWTERGVAWANAASIDETMYGEPTISVVDNLKTGALYDVKVTAAVQDALDNNELHPGIQIVGSDKDTGAFYFGLRKRARETSWLVFHWRTAAPTGQTTNRLTFVPIWSLANDGGEEWQSLLLFNLTLITESFKPFVGMATLSVYSASDSKSAGATFR